MNSISLTYARKKYTYDPDQGVLIRTCFRGKGKPAKAYMRAGTPCVFLAGYYYAHTDIAYLMHHGVWPERPTRPKDGDHSNLRPENIELS